MARDMERPAGRRTLVGTRARCAAAAILFAATAAEPACRACPRHGFAGVPEAVARSRDFALPLAPETADELVRYLAMPMPTRGTLPEDLDEPTLAPVRARYAALLALLVQRRPSAADLRERGAWAAPFDAPVWPVAVHDARVEGESLDADRVRGLFAGDFLFVFYWRRLAPASAPQRGAWTLEPEDAGRFTGLVVFPRQYAEATAAK